MSWDVFKSYTGLQWWLNWSKCHVKMLACCSLFQVGGSKKWECVAYGKMELCRGKAASSILNSLHVCAWLPPGRDSCHCRHFLIGRGGKKPRPPTTPLRKFFIILQICKFVRFNRSFTSAWVLRVFFFRLRIQEGCQDTQKVRLPEVYHFCNIFKQTVRAMRS